jgi:hypothetical protein
VSFVVELLLFYDRRISLITDLISDISHQCPHGIILSADATSLHTMEENIPISFYKVDIENALFNPDLVWHYKFKRFANLALAQAHEARTLQLRAISRGEDPRGDPPSLSQFRARLTPLATLDPPVRAILT